MMDHIVIPDRSTLNLYALGVPSSVDQSEIVRDRTHRQRVRNVRHDRKIFMLDREEKRRGEKRAPPSSLVLWYCASVSTYA